MFVPGKVGFAQWLRPGEGVVTCRKPLQHRSGRALWLLLPPLPLPPVSSGRLTLGCVPLLGKGARLGWRRAEERNLRSVTVEDGVSRRV